MYEFKTSEWTICGSMDDKEVNPLFSRYGYQARFIRQTSVRPVKVWLPHYRRDSARQDKPVFKPTWPVLALRTPVYVYSSYVEVSFTRAAPRLGAHRQSTRANHRGLVRSLLGAVPGTENCLPSYQPGDLLADDGTAIDRIPITTLGDEGSRLGQVKKRYTGPETFVVPHWKGWLSRAEAKNPT